MGYLIEIRKDGNLIDSFEMPTDVVIELMAWGRKHTHGVQQEEKITAPGAVNHKPKDKEEVKKKVRICSGCHKAGHRIDHCTNQKTGRQWGEREGDPVDMIDASRFIRIRAKNKQGMDVDEIMEDEEVTLAQFNAVIEATSWERYKAKFPH